MTIADYMDKTAVTRMVDESITMMQQWLIDVYVLR